MKVNYKGILERDSKIFINFKLEINFELYNGGEFILLETTIILGRVILVLDLDGILRGVVNLILGASRYMRMGSNVMIVLFKVIFLSGQVRVIFGFFQLDLGSRIDYDKEIGVDMLLGVFNVKFKFIIIVDYFNIMCFKVLVELEVLIFVVSIDRVSLNGIDVYIGQVGILI